MSLLLACMHMPTAYLVPTEARREQQTQNWCYICSQPSVLCLLSEFGLLINMIGLLRVL